MDLLELISRCQQGDISSGGSISLSFLASRNCLYSLVSGPLPSSKPEEQHFKSIFLSVCLCLSVSDFLPLSFTYNPCDYIGLTWLMLGCAHLRILNLITFANSLLPHKVTYSQNSGDQGLNILQWALFHLPQPP